LARIATDWFRRGRLFPASLRRRKFKHQSSEPMTDCGVVLQSGVAD
jgi:hypothetical protein